MTTPEDLMTDAIEEMETEDEYNRHESHDEQPDLEGCWLCRRAFDEAAAEHAWMNGAAKTWTGGNPYGPSDPQSPPREWYIDNEGWVKLDA
jgi:hypothetical protein